MSIRLFFIFNFIIESSIIKVKGLLLMKRNRYGFVICCGLILILSACNNNEKSDVLDPPQDTVISSS